MNSIIEKRNNMKKKKPKFIRKDAHKKLKIGKKWRKPRGHHNKMRKGLKGKALKLEVGYKSPKSAKGLDRKGMKKVEITNQKQLEQIDLKKEGIIIKKSVGLKKKIAIIKKAMEKGIKILNIKNPELIIKKEKLPKQKTTQKKESRKAKKIEEEKKTETKQEKNTEDKKEIQPKQEKDKK